MTGIGEVLPELVIEVTPTFVISTALATRDFQDVHHDPELARERGSAGIFLNILTDTGLVSRFVTDWAGPDALVRRISLRLGVPCHAHETLRLTGRVTGHAVADGEDRWEVSVVGANSLGDHVTATVWVVRR
ncbi:hypothetical protein BLA60_31370 [Actinophytocola xinjiangensis]|uniref:MaoC dehydratase-like protein n=1 Tax=Actinophytocola xinjiangensis TaxID=485602 RepID=A0A7Z1AW42_9PSEU|nr:MaoC/PaaZ C-terminal domain-containing protein [Actinophytocola xinjiangensis]OLF06471.1 hypothetical protein BLA60_31370 [Actinophytocola xinjiangensis]